PSRRRILWRNSVNTGGGRARVAPQVGARSQGQAREIRNGGPCRGQFLGRGETGWLARTQEGREPQRGSMPVRSTDEDSRRRRTGVPASGFLRPLLMRLGFQERASAE